MNQKKCMQTVSLFLAATVLAGAFTGCRRVKSHKEYVNSEYEFTVKEEPEDNSPDESSSSSSSGGSVITLPDGSSNSSGITATGKRIILEYTDEFLFSAHPTFYWNGPSKGQTVNISLYDTAGKAIFNKRGLTGSSYKCEPALTDGKEYILKMTYTDIDGKEKVVNTVGESGKKLKCIASRAANNGKNFSFKNSISFDVLNNYLSRAVTYDIGTSGRNIDECLRFLTSVGAKYVQRATGEWYPSYAYEQNNFPQWKAKLAAAHSVDPDIVFEACIFEVSSPGMNNIPIPEWVFKAFGITPEKRNFNVNLTKFKDGYGVDYWEKNHHIPDITTTEMQMFVYYRACSFIDVGFEALHLGQVKLTGKNDTNNATYAKLIGMIRDYAKTHARRGYVLINAHNNNFTGPDGTMLADMIVAPVRVHAAAGETKHEVSETNPQRCIIEKGYWNDSIYQAGISGKSPSGWYAEKYPYLVEFDNYGLSGTDTTDPNSYVWGKDEIGWYVVQPQWYRKEFMNYLVTTINGFNENGHIAFVGHRGGEFYSNNKSALCPGGSGDENFIKEIFSKN